MGSSLGELYGTPIVKGNGTPLADQLYDVIRQEILKGRWAIGERLPSYNDLSEMTRVSRRPVQEVYSRLETDGYVECIRQKGIYVKTTTSESNRTLGDVTFAIYGDKASKGIALTQTFGNWDLDGLIREAKAKGFRSKVVPVNAKGQSSAVRFDADAFGVISLVPKSWIMPMLPDTNVPVVYLGTDDPFSAPTLNGDLFMTSHMLTEELIAHGHHGIAVFALPGMDDDHLEQIVSGHASAMTAAGLQVNHAAIEMSHSLSGSDIEDVESFLREFSEATAVLCATCETADKLVETADSIGVSVPGDLSVASCQIGLLRGGSDGQFLGGFYDWTAIIERCFDILLDYESEMKAGMLRQTFKPVIGGGDSVSSNTKAMIAKGG